MTTPMRDRIPDVGRAPALLVLALGVALFVSVALLMMG